MNKNKQIFISYKRDDLEIVSKIKDEIIEHTGVDCWIDLTGIESGDGVGDKVMKAIYRADVCVFMLTKGFASPFIDPITKEVKPDRPTFCGDEVICAKELGKRMVAVSLDGTMVKDLPSDAVKFAFIGKDYIDYNNVEQRKKLLRNLRDWCGDPLRLNELERQEEAIDKKIRDTEERRRRLAAKQSAIINDAKVRKSNSNRYFTKTILWRTIICTLILALVLLAAGFLYVTKSQNDVVQSEAVVNETVVKTEPPVSSESEMAKDVSQETTQQEEKQQEVKKKTAIYLEQTALNCDAQVNYWSVGFKCKNYCYLNCSQDWVHANLYIDDIYKIENAIQNSDMEDKAIMLRGLSMYSDPEERISKYLSLAVLYPTLREIIAECCASIIIHVDENTTGKPRKAVIKIETEDETNSRKITVRQEAN